MEPTSKGKTVGKAEAIFRLILGIILIILGFFVSGTFRWVTGIIGVAILLTALFGY